MEDKLIKGKIKEDLMFESKLPINIFERILCELFDCSKLSTGKLTEEDENENEVRLKLYYYDTGRKGVEKKVHVGTCVIDDDNVDKSCWVFSERWLEFAGGGIVKTKIKLKR